MLETNYRLYAYTGMCCLLRTATHHVPVSVSHSLTSTVDNPLQTAVLNLFVSVKSRFPNLVVGSITRESVRKALVNGITAEQVGSGLFFWSGVGMEGMGGLLGHRY